MEWQPLILAAAGSLTLLSPNQTAEIPVQQEIQQLFLRKSNRGSIEVTIINPVPKL